uniref:Uncharacterized protein n=1 Tax=Lepeophtheirus salmonis TaxID=72036 RepID=A0A0K2TYE0_LEPSM
MLKNRHPDFLQESHRNQEKEFLFELNWNRRWDFFQNRTITSSNCRKKSHVHST